MIRTEQKFSGGGGGYRDWEKNCLHEKKNAEINCLPQRYIWKKIVCRDHLCYARFGEFKKIVCTAGVEEKTCKRSIDGGKNFLPPRNHDTPRGENNGPSLKGLLDVSSTHIRFVGD